MRNRRATPAALRALVDLLAPPICAACRAPCPGDSALCGECRDALIRSCAPTAPPPRGVDLAWAAAAHEGVARELVAGLKFRGLLRCADAIAEAIAVAAPPQLLGGTLVPVPPSPARLRRRGFDPAGEIAAALARISGAEFAACLTRSEGPRQVGRPRRQRLATPPRVSPRGLAPPRAVLVDDVQTTGATLTACASALRSAGTVEVMAIAFARTP